MTEKKEFDYLIVGSGLFGAVFAHEMQKLGKKCLVIDKRKHLGGNVYTKNIKGINVHMYGAHIFHTNDKRIWDYVNSFVEFNNFINSPLANLEGRIYNLPFNMNTFYQLWKTKKPCEAKKILEKQILECNIGNPNNLEEQAIKMVGHDIYSRFIKEYTQKQWGKEPSDLPAYIIKRIPVRFTFNNNYYDDRYQGVPIGGYSKLINKLLENIETRTDVNYFKYKRDLDLKSNKIVFTGPIDEYFEHKLGKLEYRSLSFEHENLLISDYQGNAVVNFPELRIPYTRIIEHKHFEFGNQSHTVITREYPADYNRNQEPYYPINNLRNEALFNDYKQLAFAESQRTILGGRLGTYKYYDMHQVIASALTAVKKEIK